MSSLFERIRDMFVPPPVKTKTVLVVEDSEVDRTLIVRSLSRHYNILTAHDGREGVEVALQQRPDLIVMDYMMPMMNGPESCRLIKQDERMKDVPVIFLTSMDTPRTVIDGLEEGAEAYLVKPIGMKTILEEVNLRIQPVVNEKVSDAGY